MYLTKGIRDYLKLMLYHLKERYIVARTTNHRKNQKCPKGVVKMAFFDTLIINRTIKIIIVYHTVAAISENPCCNYCMINTTFIVLFIITVKKAV